MADISSCCVADHIAVRRGYWSVWLHLVLGRTRALEPGDWIRQYLAARIAGPDDNRYEAGYLCAWNIDECGVLSRHFLGVGRHSCAAGATTTSRVGCRQGNGVGHDPEKWVPVFRTGYRRIVLCRPVSDKPIS